MRAPERLLTTRIVALPSALDAVQWPEGALVFRLAPDEVLVTAQIDAAAIADPHAIVERDTGFAGMWISNASAIALLERECDWELPVERPAFAQGLVAGLPVKLWFEHDRVCFVVAAPLVDELMGRLR